jgi:hypothetical protein
MLARHQHSTADRHLQDKRPAQTRHSKLRSFAPTDQPSDLVLAVRPRHDAAIGDLFGLIVAPLGFYNELCAISQQQAVPKDRLTIMELRTQAYATPSYPTCLRPRQACHMAQRYLVDATYSG